MQILKLETLIDLEDNGLLPIGFGFRIKGGTAVYKSIGSQWRRSGHTMFLSPLGFDEFETKADEKKRRYISDDTLIELINI